MYSSVIGKVEKARMYSEEKGRVTFKSFVAEFEGENGDHRIEYNEESLTCSCLFFAGHEFCSHSMAIQRILEGMLPLSDSHPN